MSKLEELIKEFCPNGVEYKKIKECYNRLKGTPITAGKMKEIESSVGNVTIFAGGKTVVVAKEQDIPNANIIRVPAVVVQSRGIIDVIYCNSPFTFKNEMWAYSSKEETSVKYLFYYLKSKIQLLRDSAAGMGALPQISLSATEELQIPLPALPVQREIVRILDSFTLYSAELTARRKQYEFYRDKLLNFNTSIEETTIGNIALVTKLAGFEFTNYVKYSDFGNVIALRGLNVKNGKLDLTDVKYIDGSDFSKLNRSKLQIGDMLFTYVGTIGQVALIEEDDKYYLAPNVALIRLKRKDIMPKYIRYYFQSNAFFSTQILRLLQSSSMQNIPMEKIRKFVVKIPPLEVQKRIVKVLDNFDAICADLGIGLPAEIEKRQKQYEYYRDKLLTFEEKNNNGEK